MKFVFWLSLILILLTYFGLPAVLWFLSKFPRKRYVTDSEYEPDVSVIIPVHNEENILKEKIENCLKLNYPAEKLEIIFALDGCTDKSKQIIEMYAKKNIKIFELRKRSGKMAALNAACETAQSQVLIFNDADIMLDSLAIKKLVVLFSNKKIGCVAGQLNYNLKNSSAVEQGEHLYFKYEKFLRQKESILGALLVVSGSIYAMRKDLYLPIDTRLADDFVNPLRVLAQGFDCVYASNALAYGTSSNTIEDEFVQRIRMVQQGLTGTLVEAKTIAGLGFGRFSMFLFHKLVRWFVPILLSVLFISNAFILKESFYKNFFCVSSVFYLLAIVGALLQIFRKKIKLFYVPFYFCLSNLAALAGIIKFMTKKTEVTWERAHSTR